MYPIDTAAITDGSATHVYNMVDLGKDPNADASSVRVESAAPADQAAKLTIKHKVVGKDLGEQTQSMIRFDRITEDANGNQGTVSCQLTLRWPHKIAAAATAQKQINELIAFFAVAGYKDKFTAREP